MHIPTWLCIKQIKDNDKLVNFYTGFPSFLHLLACFEFLGPAVAILPYDPTRCIENPTKACNSGQHHILTPLNEFFFDTCQDELVTLTFNIIIVT